MKKIDDLLKSFPKEIISLLPTPLHRLNSLSELLGRELYVKRDDLTGFAFGGNKTRKFDFLIADATKKGCDTVIGIGANQSNFCRILAGVGSKYGLKVHLILNGVKPDKPTGNLLIDHLLGATVHHIDTTDPDERLAEAERIRETLEYQGKRVYFLPPGGSTTIGTLGYIAGWSEILDDLAEQELAIDTVIHASSSAGTQAGLVAGQAISQWPGRIIGMSVDVPQENLQKDVHKLAQAAGDLFNCNINRELIHVDDSYVGEGYGIRTPACEEAVELFAKQEGIFLDYVYTGKAASGLIDYCHSGKIAKEEKVLFIHTGGNVELFE